MIKEKIKEIDMNLVEEGNIDLGDKVFDVLAHDFELKFSERGQDNTGERRQKSVWLVRQV